MEDNWYADLRERWRPDPIRVLLIGESAPDPGHAHRRFFYAEPVDRYDNLFRGVVDAFYGAKVTKGDEKRPWLECLRQDAVFLIDLVPYPVNALPQRARRIARADSVGACAAYAVRLQPDGVVVCHEPSYRVLARPLREAGVPLLHDEAMPFPIGNTRAEFVRLLRAAAARVGLTLPRRCT